MSAESAGDLLSDLDHSEILLRLVVGEGEDGVEGTPEDLAGVFFEAPEEVLGGGGLGSSSPFLGLWAAGLFPSLEEERLKASQDLLSFGLTDQRDPGGGFLLEVEKEGGHLQGPDMVVELGDRRQLPENRGVAKGMGRGKGEGGAPEIGDHRSPDRGKHAQGGGPLPAPLFVKPQESPSRG